MEVVVVIFGRPFRWRMIPRKIKGGGPQPLLLAARRMLGARPTHRVKKTFHPSLVERMMDGELPPRLQLPMLSIRPADGTSLHLVLILNLDRTLPLNVLNSTAKPKFNLLPLTPNNLVNIINKPLIDKSPWPISKLRSEPRVQGGTTTLRPLRHSRKQARSSILVPLPRTKHPVSRVGEARDKTERFRSRTRTKLHLPNGATLLLLNPHRTPAEDGLPPHEFKRKSRLLVRSA
jgi:hypothetical protein